MDSFALVDLQVQRQQVADYIAGKPLREVLDWMCEHGTVIETTGAMGKLYIFKSPAGIKSGFYFTPEGRLMVIASGFLPAF
jgi:hypothetical protein